MEMHGGGALHVRGVMHAWSYEEKKEYRPHPPTRISLLFCTLNAHADFKSVGYVGSLLLEAVNGDGTAGEGW